MKDNYQELIKEVKNNAKQGLSKIAYETWISPLDIFSIDGDVVTLLVQTPFFADQVKPYEPLLINCFKEATNKIFSINYMIANRVGEQTRSFS